MNNTDPNGEFLVFDSATKFAVPGFRFASSEDAKEAVKSLNKANPRLFSCFYFLHVGKPVPVNGANNG